MKRKALGKGLGSLIPSSLPKTASDSQAIQPAARPTEFRLEISKIRPNRKQPRQAFAEESLDELARSLKAQGLLQPVVVRPSGGGLYELIAGERRWRAAQRAGIHQIPAVIRDVPDERMLELALIENLQREELNAIEEAEAYRILIDDLGSTQQEISDRVGKQRATVANALRLLQLPPRVQDLVRSKKLSMGHARALLALQDPKAIVALAELTVEAGLSVREVEARAKRPAGSTRRAGRPPREPDPNVVAAEQKLQRALGARVRILGTPAAGRVEIQYSSAEELDRIYRLMLDAGKHPN